MDVMSTGSGLWADGARSLARTSLTVYKRQVAVVWWREYGVVVVVVFGGFHVVAWSVVVTVTVFEMDFLYIFCTEGKMGTPS